MNITYHAAERFLQRVFNFTTYTKKQIFLAKKLIAKDLSNLKTHKLSSILPSFPDFVAIFKDNKVVTIIKKT